MKQFGFEIEGEFSGELYKKLQTIGVMKEDGSVHHCGEGNCSHLELGEFNSKPYSVKSIRLLKKFFDMLHAEYTKGNFHFNKTCGFHIHISFTEGRPVEIFSRQFTNFFLKSLKSKQKKVMEMRSGNKFCKLTLTNQEIEKPGYGERYRFINLWDAYLKHGTIEFRIFPSYKPKAMYRYIVFTLGQINTFLQRPITVRAKTEIDFAKVTTENHEVTANLRREFINTSASEAVEIPF